MKNIAPLVLLFCIALLFLWPVLSGQEHLYFRDTLIFTLPAKWFLSHTSPQFLALWNPRIFMGYPQFAVPSNGPFYPLNLILRFAPIATTYPYYIFAHFLLALGFTYGFVKNLTQRWEAGFFAAMAFGFSGYVTFSAAAHVGFASMVWLPAILFFIQKGAQHRRHVLFAGLCAGLQILGGEIHYCAMTLMVALGFCLSTFPLKKAVSTFAMLFATAIGIAAVQIIPTLEFLARSNRASGLSWEEATIWSFHPLRLLEFLTPFPFGSIFPNMRSYRGGQFFPLRFNQPFILSVYFGVVPILFFLLSVRQWGQKHNRLWIGFTLLFLLLGFGPWSPFFWIAHHLPPFSTMRYPEKFIWIASFCMIVIAAKAFAYFSTSKRLLCVLLLILSTLDLFMFSKQVFLTTPLDIFALRTPWMTHLDSQRLLRFSDFQPQFSLPLVSEVERDHAISFLSGKENTLVLTNHSYTYGYDGLTLGNIDQQALSQLSKTFLDHSGTKWILAGYNDAVPDGLNLEYESNNLNLRLWKNSEASPLVSLQKPDAKPKAIEFQRPSGDEIRVTLAQGEIGELVVNETNYPGWEVWVDGKKADLIAKGSFGKAVTLKGSERNITFKFSPRSFHLGLMITLLTLLTAGILILKSRVTPLRPQ